MSYTLPPINDMYRVIMESSDMNVVRNYQNCRKDLKIKVKATKKGHYIDDLIKYSTSPGPANNSNLQNNWTPKDIKSLKHSQRKTYIDQVQHLSKKQNIPSPNRYNIQMNWPKPSEPIKNICEKLSFLDTVLYESDKYPGPGTYQIATKIAEQKKDGKIVLNNPLQPRENIAADMNTYNPCPLEYSTFSRIQLNNKSKTKSTPNLNKSSIQGKKIKKQKQLPGPGYYQMINTWKGKGELKKGQVSYMNKISKKSTGNIYYGS